MDTNRVPIKPTPTTHNPTESSPGPVRSGLTTVFLAGVMLLFFPAIIVFSAVALVVLAWPLFVGAYLSHGIIPFIHIGGGLRISQSEAAIGSIWYLLTGLWLITLAATPVAIARLRKRREARRLETTVEDLLTPDDDPVGSVANKPRPK